jgi:uncharacterized protein (TIGR03790 family)
MKFRLKIIVLVLCALAKQSMAENAIDIGNLAIENKPTTLKVSAIKPDDVAVIVNEQDVNSVMAGDYYLNARNIPRKNLIKVSIATGQKVITEEQFLPMREKIYAGLGQNIQVITLMWTTPYAVNCNSITSAVSLGYDKKQCENGCAIGKDNPYFNSSTRNPSKDFNMRLAMLLPTDSIELAKKIIDRGVLSGFKLATTTGYFLKTSDKDRSKPREQFYPRDLTKIESKKLFLRTLNTDAIKNKKDVMFYFTGQASVADLNTLNFVPGAIADHLTSFGGVLYNDVQMSSLKWLEAGATGSYGTVSEPCNYWQKFPNPQLLLKYYLEGETLVEAYWKSVFWPTQGLFIGEPLAAPYLN